MIKICILTLSLILSLGYCSAQGNIKGITFNSGSASKKTDKDIRAFKTANPEPKNFIPKLRPKGIVNPPSINNPEAKAVSIFGSMVTTATQHALTTVATAPAQTLWSNFLTIWGNYGTAKTGRESPYTPPDNCGDVGFTQVVATANCRLKVFSKPSVTGRAVTTATGTSTTPLAALVNLDLNAFFSNSNLGITAISDPHVRFDRLSGRWFVVAIDITHGTNNYCCVAVSVGPVITGAASFTIFYFNVSQTGGSAMDFFDYPTLGVDKNYLYIGGNMFTSGNKYSGSNIWVVNKAKLMAGTLTVTGFPYSITKTDMYTPQGVHNDDTTITNGFLIGASQTILSKLIIKKVIYGTMPALSADLGLSTSVTASPSTVPTLGGIAIDGGDNRLNAAMIKRNLIAGTSSLWVAQGTLLTQGGIGSNTGDRDGALWMEIGNLSGTPFILQSANLYDGVNAKASATYYIFPTIATSGQGHSLLGFTASGPAKYAQASATGRFRTDSAGTLKVPIDFTNTTSSYHTATYRWGDFTQTVVDPSDNMTMWTFSEYAPAANAWGVRAAQYKAPAPATPSIAHLNACATGLITINGTSTNNSEFFDPGAGYPNRLNVTVTGASTIDVANITFVNPTQITASFKTASAVAGTYTLTIINPDGQKSSTTFSIGSGCRVITENPSITRLIDNKEYQNALTKVYPNPAASILHFELASNTNQKVLVELFDMSGQKVLSQQQQITKGLNRKQLAIHLLGKGTYYLQITDEQNEVIGKVAVVKK